MSVSCFCQNSSWIQNCSAIFISSKQPCSQRSVLRLVSLNEMLPPLAAEAAVAAPPLLRSREPRRLQCANAYIHKMASMTRRSSLVQPCMFEWRQFCQLLSQSGGRFVSRCVSVDAGVCGCLSVSEQQRRGDNGSGNNTENNGSVVNICAGVAKLSLWRWREWLAYC